MSVWAWIAIGLLGWLLLSIVVGLLVAALLGRLDRDVAARIPGEALASVLLRRAHSRSVSKSR
jgi:hypothetical protein